MKVIVIGNGGREDSIRWKLKNEGISIFHDIDTVSSEDLVVVGPEVPIAEGLTDELVSDGIPVFGPSKLAGRLETSKLWAKQFMQRHDIPTAKWLTFTRDSRGMTDAMDSLWHRDIIPIPKYPVVLKEDGLCGGKGVVVCKNRFEANNIIPWMFINNKFNSSSHKILFEDFIDGVEASCFVLTDGKDYKILPYCQDYKPVGEDNTGPNTGGMGAFCPTARVTEEVKKRVEEEIVIPTLEGMREEGLPYKGVLYIGLMITSNEPYVIEYNARFGDPECQVLMMLMKSDLYPLLKSVAEGNLGEQPDPEFYDGSALTVVMCSGGYPGEYEKGYVIDFGSLMHQIKIHYFLNTFSDIQLFHAGTKWEGDRYVTDGGRVLNVTARGDSLEDARERAYKVTEKISWENSFYRSDIGSV